MLQGTEACSYFIQISSSVGMFQVPLVLEDTATQDGRMVEDGSAPLLANLESLTGAILIIFST